MASQISPISTGFLDRITIQRGALLFSIIIFVVIAGLVGVSKYRGDKGMIGSEDYLRVIEGKRLLGDVRPPSLYIVEAYIGVVDAINHPEGRDEAIKTYGTAKQAFFKRVDFWLKTDIPDQLKNDVIIRARDSLAPFWKEVEEVAFPLLKTPETLQRRAELHQSMDRLRSVFKAHRNSFSQVILEEVSSRHQRVSAEVKEHTQTLDMVFYVTSAFAALLIMFLVYLVYKRIVWPIEHVSQFTSALAKGEARGQVPYTRRGDEIGDLARALTIFQEAVDDRARKEREIGEERERNASIKADADAEIAAQAKATKDAMEALGEGLRRMAKGDLSQLITTPFEGDLDRMRIHFNESCKQVGEAFGDIVDATTGLNGGIKEIVTVSDDMSKRAERQAASLEETFSTLSEVTKTVEDSSKSLTLTRDSAASARSDAEASGEIVVRALSAMGDIEQSAKEINQIISVIDEIAFQTNLLALNAGVEAARAGDAGQGFAVVASEVRALAQRSAVAAKEIKGLISKSTEQVANGSKLVDETGSTLHRIADQVMEISGNVDELAARASEQSKSLKSLNSSASEMDSMTQQSAAIAQQSTAAAHSLSREADRLSSLVSNFKTACSTLKKPEEPKQQNETNDGFAAGLQAKLSNAFSGLKTGTGANIGNAALAEEWEEF